MPDKAKTERDRAPSGDAGGRAAHIVWIRRIWRFGAETVVVLLMALMVGTLLIQVFGRFVLLNPPAWTEELARYAFVWITYLGAAVAFRHRAHVVVDVVVSLLPARARDGLTWVVDGLLAVALGVLLWHGIEIVRITSNVQATMLQVPMSLMYAAVPVSAALMLAYLVELVLDRLRCGTNAAPTVPN